MPTLMPWNSVEIGDLDVFAPALPSLVVYTWYVDDRPESSITHLWRDDATGLVQHELVFVAPVTFEEAVTRAQGEAPKRSVERIHVKHARSSDTAKSKAKPKRTTRARVSPPKTRTPQKLRTGKPGSARRKQRA